MRKKPRGKPFAKGNKLAGSRLHIRNWKTIIKEQLDEIIKQTDDDKPWTRQDAIVKAFLNKCTEGDTRAIKVLLDKFMSDAPKKVQSKVTVKDELTELTEKELIELLKKYESKDK